MITKITVTKTASASSPVGVGQQERRSWGQSEGNQLYCVNELVHIPTVFSLLSSANETRSPLGVNLHSILCHKRTPKRRGKDDAKFFRPFKQVSIEIDLRSVNPI